MKFVLWLNTELWKVDSAQLVSVLHCTTSRHELDKCRKEITFLFFLFRLDCCKPRVECRGRPGGGAAETRDQNSLQNSIRLPEPIQGPASAGENYHLLHLTCIYWVTIKAKTKFVLTVRSID